jgi:chromosome segregation ATPase
MGKLFRPKVLATIVALVGIGSVLFAQGTRPTDGSAQDALLAEVRALRAEIHQVAGTGIRMQLLVARLQLQEQRVFTVARQLTDAQNALASARARLAGEQSRVRQLEEAASRATGTGRLTYQQAILEAGPHIEQQQRQELDLRARETELLRSVNDAQARWMDFNNRLDALEQSLPASVGN